MPLYQYSCSECNQTFEELVFGSQTSENISCPTCGSKQVQRNLSRVAGLRAGNSTLNSGFNAAPTCSSSGGL